MLQRLESLAQAGVLDLPKGSFTASATPPAVAKTSEMPTPVSQQPMSVQPQPPQPVQQSAPPQPTSPQRPTLQPTTPAQPVAPKPPAVVKAPAVASSIVAGSVVAGSVISASATLDVLQQHVTGCTACGELASTRTQTVFGVGNPNARLCFVGEAPGADEDRQGEPFVGKAGQLLTKIIEACHLTRDEVYILNVLKCRPPGNRNPTPDEATACRPFLQRQLELIKPEFVCCLGAIAAQNFLETDQSIGRLRGRVHEHRGLQVVCTYHPAYLLRNPSAKRATWDDMKLLMSLMGVTL